MTEDFVGLAAAVTGGASGIGAAVVAELTRSGATVAALDLEPDAVPSQCLGIRTDDGRTDSERQRSRQEARAPITTPSSN
jgi:NAD(P)-dependent dehydrogenase (short-subunit alcohol dehydrogenase family)